MAENWLMILDEVRALALNGLNYEQILHDREWYDRLLKIVLKDGPNFFGYRDNFGL